MGTPLPYDERLERLLDTAAGVFAEKGYHSTTMRDLARATGMSLAGMYHYVSGKDELLYRIQERCFTEVLDGAERAVGRDGPPVSRLEWFIAHHVMFFTRHMAEMKVLSHEATSLTGERLDRIKAIKRRYVDLLAQLIRAVNRAADPGVDPMVAAYTLFGMMNWIYTWYDPKGTVSPDALSRQITRIFLHGLTESTPTPVSHGG